MTESRNHLVGRPDWTRRLLLGGLGAVFGVLAVWGTAIGNRVAPVFLALSLVGLSELWRHVRVADGRLVAQGRLSRRSVELSDLTGIGLSPVLRPWVAPRDGQAFYLRMVNDLGSRGTNPGPVVFVEQLRAAAEQAGASLADETAPRSAPPSGAAPFFSA